MPKLAKNMWTNSKGERKLNCYVVNISKEIVNQTDLKDKEIKVFAKDNKIRNISQCCLAIICHNQQRKYAGEIK